MPDGYLNSGYFDEKGHLRPELLTTTAIAVARALKQAGLTSGQLRDFWGMTLWAKRRLEMDVSFEEVVVDIYKLEPKAAYAAGRNVAPRLFKDFIDKNVALAVRSIKEFGEGFYEHFQAVVAYHKFFGG